MILKEKKEFHASCLDEIVIFFKYWGDHTKYIDHVQTKLNEVKFEFEVSKCKIMLS